MIVFFFQKFNNNCFNIITYKISLNLSFINKKENQI